MSTKNSNDTIGNRSRDLPFCSSVPQPLRHRVLPVYSIQMELPVKANFLYNSCVFKYYVHVKLSLLFISVYYRLEYFSFRWENSKAIGLLNSDLYLETEIWNRCELAMLKSFY
jgi:hypothetical protein